MGKDKKDLTKEEILELLDKADSELRKKVALSYTGYNFSGSYEAGTPNRYTTARECVQSAITELLLC